MIEQPSDRGALQATAWFGRSVLASVMGVLAMAVLAGLSGCDNLPKGTPSELKAAAEQCERDRDLPCAEQNWQAFVKARPTDTYALANLGIVQNWRDEPEDAVVTLKKAIDLGEGTYDIFAAYAQSLGKLGRTDEAIDWSYKTLTVVPSLVDVRGNLAKLLLQKNRRYEALGLLASFDDHLQSLGQGPYFTGQRISLESAPQVSPGQESSEQHELRIAKIGTPAFFAPVGVGSAPVASFIIDTGATNTSMSDVFLSKTKVAYEIIQPDIIIQMADGHHIHGKLIHIDSLRVGAFPVKNVHAVVCGSCALLLGQESLSQFDMISSKVQGVEFLTLKPRNAG